MSRQLCGQYVVFIGPLPHPLCDVDCGTTFGPAQTEPKDLPMAKIYSTSTRRRDNPRQRRIKKAKEKLGSEQDPVHDMNSKVPVDKKIDKKPGDTPDDSSPIPKAENASVIDDLTSQLEPKTQESALMREWRRRALQNTEAKPGARTLKNEPAAKLESTSDTLEIPGLAEMFDRLSCLLSKEDNLFTDLYF